MEMNQEMSALEREINWLWEEEEKAELGELIPQCRAAYLFGLQNSLEFILPRASASFLALCSDPRAAKVFVKVMQRFVESLADQIQDQIQSQTP